MNKIEASTNINAFIKMLTKQHGDRKLTTHENRPFHGEIEFHYKEGELKYVKLIEDIKL